MKWEKRPIKRRTRAPNKIDLTADFVRSILDYDSESGLLTWKYRENIPANWNTKYAGEEAGYINNQGYQFIGINGSRYLAHRLAWLIVTGEWPKDKIDHEDGDPSNNKFSNLREATQQENNRNRKTNSNNTSGVKGVYWNKPCQKWQVQIKIDGTSTHLGYFDSFDEAVAVRKLAELEHFGKFRRKLT
jgi:hypothetical protein